MAKIIGIDLGTTNCCVGVVENGTPKVIPSRDGARTIPSFVAFSTDGERLVGQPAVRQAVTNPSGTIFGAKRLIGRKVNTQEVRAQARVAPYKIVAAANGDAWLRVNDKPISPQEISGELLKHIKEQAENHVGEPITKAVVTVPAYFNEAQRQATRDAGSIAGVEVVRILNEPTAAALAYGVHRLKDTRSIIAVFDLGGGTFDVSIMAIENGLFEVLSTNGNSSLGGGDWDEALVAHLVDHVFDTYRIDITEHPVALGRLKEAASDAKVLLSSAQNHIIRLPFLAQTPQGEQIDLEYSISRAEFEAMTQSLCDKLVEPCKTAMDDAGLSPGDLDEVLLVGGMSRSPAVQLRVAEIFGQQPSKSANPDEVVAVGAATYAGILAGGVENAALLDVTPHDIGIKVGNSDFSVVMPRNSMLPARVRKLFATSHDDQDFVRIELYQGDGDDVRNNKRLGAVTLEDLPRAPAGQVKIELVITVDVESIMRVTATELTTGKAAVVRVQPFGGLSRKEIGEIIEKQRHAESPRQG